MFKTIQTNIFACILLLISTSAWSMDWSASSFEFLKGDNYKVPGVNDIPGKHRTILTFVHANGWAYGDNLIWFDVTNPTKKGTSVYTEISPRLSFSKMSKRDFSVGIIKDFLAAFTLEAGSARAYLWGIGIDWEIPGFSMLQTNFYSRKTPHIHGSGYQLTIAWALPFEIKNLKFEFLGCLDWVPDTYGNDATGKINRHLFSAPQLLFDLGSTLGKDGHIYIGFEYQIWQNKFGTKSTDLLNTNERVLQYMIKWVI